MKQRFLEGLPPLRAVDPSIPEPVEALVMRCLRDGSRRALSDDRRNLCARWRDMDDAGELIPRTDAADAANAGVRPSGSCCCSLAGMYFATRSWFTPPVARPPVSVLVADFDNRTGDPDFEGAVEQTLTAALETASFVTVYPAPSAGELAAKLKPGTAASTSRWAG